jgi:hypothetical protein
MKYVHIFTLAHKQARECLREETCSVLGTGNV